MILESKIRILAFAFFRWDNLFRVFSAVYRGILDLSGSIDRALGTAPRGPSLVSIGLVEPRHRPPGWWKSRAGGQGFSASTTRLAQPDTLAEADTTVFSLFG